jgi:hypothetical protein
MASSGLAKGKKTTHWISSGTRGFPSSNCSEFGFFGLFSLRLRGLQLLKLTQYYITISGLAKQGLNFLRGPSPFNHLTVKPGKLDLISLTIQILLSFFCE